MTDDKIPRKYIKLTLVNHYLLGSSFCSAFLRLISPLWFLSLHSYYVIHLSFLCFSFPLPLPCHHALILFSMLINAISSSNPLFPHSNPLPLSLPLLLLSDLSIHSRQITLFRLHPNWRPHWYPVCMLQLISGNRKMNCLCLHMQPCARQKGLFKILPSE